MNNVYLSKSKYCRVKQCNKMLWLDKNKPECGEFTTDEAINDRTNKQYQNLMIQDHMNKYHVNIHYIILKKKMEN